MLSWHGRDDEARHRRRWPALQSAPMNPPPLFQTSLKPPSRDQP